MGAAFIWASAAVAVIGIAAACGGTAIDSTRSGHPAEAGGAPGDGGASGSSGDSTAGTGTGGAGGAATATGGTPPFEVTIAFVATGVATLCHHGCVPPSMTISDDTGHALDLGNWCRTDCATCSVNPCPSIPCLPDDEISDITRTWDGTFYASSTCGPQATPCFEARTAPQGTYVATVCAQQGAMTYYPDGSTRCTNRCSEVCGSVKFEVPSNGVVKGVIYSDTATCR
jgi:hypothetical protein